MEPWAIFILCAFTFMVLVIGLGVTIGCFYGFARVVQKLGTIKLDPTPLFTLVHSSPTPVIIPPYEISMQERYALRNFWLGWLVLIPIAFTWTLLWPIAIVTTLAWLRWEAGLWNEVKTCRIASQQPDS